MSIKDDFWMPTKKRKKRKKGGKVVIDIESWVQEKAGILDDGSKGSVHVSVLNSRGDTIGFKVFDYTVGDVPASFEEVNQE